MFISYCVKTELRERGTMGAIGYIRVSAEDQVQKGLNLDAQKAKIEAWTDLNDYVLDTIYCDAGINR